MHQHLLRHFEVHTASREAITELWLRVTCCLTLLLPLWTSLTVGRKTKETSDQYILSTTPPDKFFRIWIVIYLLEVFVMVYAAVEDCWILEIWIEFSIINISCAVWAFAFNSGKLWAVNLSIFCQFVNLAMNELIWINLGDLGKNIIVGSTSGIIIRNFVAFFNGWFIAAAALGLFVFLVYTLGMSLKTQLLLFWIAAPVVYAAFLVYNIAVVGPLGDTLGIFFSMGWAVVGAALASINRNWFPKIG